MRVDEVYLRYATYDNYEVHEVSRASMSRGGVEEYHPGESHETVQQPEQAQYQQTQELESPLGNLIDIFA